MKTIPSNTFFSTPDWSKYKKIGDSLFLVSKKDFTLFKLPKPYEIWIGDMVLTGSFILDFQCFLGLVLIKENTFSFSGMIGNVFPSAFKVKKYRKKLKRYDTVFEY